MSAAGILARAARLAVAGAAAALIGCAAHAHASPQTMHATATRAPAAARHSQPWPARTVIGRSVHGRSIVVTRAGNPTAAVRVLVVGCIHGDERAGIPIARRLERLTPPAAVAIWTVPDLNPDGAAADTRQNAHRVDLNRNFPWRWRALGRPGDQQYSGRHPLSEPESRAAAALIRRVQPAITIWFHQPLGLVDESGGSLVVERRFARLTGLPLRRLTRYPGSAASWQDHALRGTTAFVVELPAQPLAPTVVARYARAVIELAAGRRAAAGITPPNVK